jgi:hypothetical protein
MPDDDLKVRWTEPDRFVRHQLLVALVHRDRLKGQIDFNDDPELIGPAADAIAKFFRASLQKL